RTHNLLGAYRLRQFVDYISNTTIVFIVEPCILQWSRQTPSKNEQFLQKTALAQARTKPFT
ncbi:hypothetical protein OAG76_04950, partial [Rubripirellula sp.]